MEDRRLDIGQQVHLEEERIMIFLETHGQWLRKKTLNRPWSCFQGENWATKGYKSGDFPLLALRVEPGG